MRSYKIVYFKDRRLMMWLIVIFFLVNLLQAAFTGLAHDEAYYWMYSRYLDYGYFDHPPAIAVLIRAGYALIPGELGVRLPVVCMGTLLIPILYALTSQRSFLLFFLLFGSVAVFQVYSFIAVPDAPLLFFTATFFLAYRRFIAQETLLNTVLLGLNCAALLYCKYHGLLVIFFTLLSNLSLFRRKHFYIVVLIAIGAYLPHIAWQIKHDYPSYQYHVLNKSQNPYNPLDTLAFLGGQLLIAGPLTGFLLFYAAFRKRMTNRYNRALKFTLTGFLIFFFCSTLNARVEPNWTAAAFVPLIILGYDYLSEKERLRKWLTVLALISWGIVLTVRLNLATDLVPAFGSRLLPEFYGWEKWAAQIHARAGKRPVVFTNSYQKAAKYSFYTKEPALSLNNIMYRQNQYDLWDIEDRIRHKRVMYIANWPISGKEVHELKTVKEAILYVFIDNFQSYTRVEAVTPEIHYTFQATTRVKIPFILENHYPHPLRFGLSTTFRDQLVYCLFREEVFLREGLIEHLGHTTLNRKKEGVLYLDVPEQSGTYYLRIGVRHGWLVPTINSRLIRINVQKR